MHQQLQCVKPETTARVFTLGDSSGKRKRWSGVVWSWLCWAAMLVPQASPADDIRYSYDEMGRLRSVTALSGASGQYVYDAVGNLKRIVRVPAGVPVILEFSPNGGAVGTPVRVFGANFDAIAANNAVAFNGKPALVSAASATEITASVPAGATTGKLSVRTPVGTATSTEYFRVGRDFQAQPPVITGFSPASGLAGTQVTIQGRNFDSVPGAARVALNQRAAEASFVSPSTIVTKVPQQVGSGPWQVTTLAGNAVSASDFLIVPPGVPVADVLHVTRVQLGQVPKGVGIDQEDKAIALVYANQPGEWLSLQFFGIAIVPVDQKLTYKVFSPTLALVATGSLDIKHQTIHLPMRTDIGYFTVVVDAPAATIATALVQLVRGASLVADGPAVSEQLDAGQSARLTFQGVVGENLGLGLFDGTTVIDPTIYAPDGKLWLSGGGASRSELDLNKLPATGTYQVVLVPRNGAGAAFQASLSADVAGALTVGQAAVVATTRFGQNGRLNFDGKAGQGLGLAWRSVSAATSGILTIYRPTGASLSSGTFATGQKGALDLTLPETGSYSVLIDPGLADAAQLDFVLSADVDSGALAIDGTATPVATSLFGQNARSSFSGAAGQKLGLAWRNVSLASATSGNFVIYRPNGGVVSSGYFSPGQKGSLNLTLPEAGTYRVFVNPGLADAANVDFQLSADVNAGTLAVDGAALTVATALFGQNAGVRFDGTAGQSLVLAWDQATVAGGTSVSFTVYRPGGQYLTAAAAFPGQAGSRMLSLPDTGTYTIFVEPGVADSATLTFTLRSP